MAQETKDHKAKILIVDDQRSLRIVLTRLLQARGYEVLSAPSGAEALATCRRRGPVQLLVTDFTLPDVTGPELADRIRSRDPDTAVLTMSGYPRSMLEETNPMYDAYGFIEKPFAVEKLLAIIETMLS